MISLKNKLGDGMIKQLLNLVMAKLFASADLLATDKSRYFAQPRPIIVNYSFREQLQRSQCTIKVVPTRCSFRQRNFFIPIRITSITNETSTERPMFSLRKHPTFRDATPDFPAK